MTLFKDMTDQALEDAIDTTRRLLYSAAEIRAHGQQGRLLRDLDIAIAVKRQRQRAGTWFPVPEPEPDLEHEGFDADAAYERYLETRYEEDPRDLFDEAQDVGLQAMRAARAEGHDHRSPFDATDTCQACALAMAQAGA